MREPQSKARPPLGKTGNRAELRIGLAAFCVAKPAVSVQKEGASHG